RALEFLDAKLTLPVPEALNATAEPLTPTAAAQAANALAEGRIALHLNWSHSARPSDDLIRKTILWTWRVKLSLSLERDLFARLREDAENVAIKVFADNLRDLLLAAPAGPRVVLGLDPGIRTGVKVAVVDATGKLVETSTVYPHEPRRDWDGALHTLNKLCQKHGVNLIAIGNGTASRETDKLAADLIKQLKTPDSPEIQKVVVSEAGASVYSASEFASQEMPDVDVSLRGAASIARRLQDPLAELVKIDPKSIGVGQYQHDVNQTELARTLPELFANDKFGVMTVKDILLELEKPGRDPRPDFKVARFNEGVDDIRDLKEGMVLEGTVSNVAAFGAFVDLGVHQDGLVHVSQLSNKFITDAREVVKTGDIVKVKVTEVDVARKRIGLTMKLSDASPSASQRGRENKFEGVPRHGHQHQRSHSPAPSGGLGQSAMASAFAKLQNKG
ncbi:MAG: S1 RNA-binding domain-containing protein, partial [Betaproteobacteria bacterium]|nr:S1 RNA-binding domain-containing protein [Betaproteobacteria bacterium]